MTCGRPASERTLRTLIKWSLGLPELPTGPFSFVTNPFSRRDLRTFIHSLCARLLSVLKLSIFKLQHVTVLLYRSLEPLVEACR